MQAVIANVFKIIKAHSNSITKRRQVRYNLIPCPKNRLNQLCYTVS